MSHLGLAAYYLRVLSAVEQAHALGDEEQIVSMLAGVDPIELKDCTAHIEGLAETVSVPRIAGAEPRPHPGPPSDPPAGPAGLMEESPNQPSAPASPIQNYSIRVPRR